jgi:hypothetical protein
MSHDLPSPEQILEELGDKAAAQIDQLAPVAFDAALNEMTRYHRFLLGAYASVLPNGTPFNYAEVGRFFTSQHDEWIRQYRRLFERAANRIGDDPDFLHKLAYVPSRLLPRDGDPKMSSAVLKGIIDLGPLLVHRLEAWLTKRTVVDNRPGDTASPRLVLAGSDRKAYERVVTNVVGAWESLLQRAPSLYGWREHGSQSNAERWVAFSKSWEFLSAHLTNTAYLLAISVWNEDEPGTAIYRDALIRWPETLSHELRDTSELLDRRLLFPDVLNKDWANVIEHVRPLLAEYMPSPGPNDLFGAIVKGAHEDVLLVTAALLLYWFMNEKQATHVGARASVALLRHEMSDPDQLRHHEPGGGRSFHSLFLDTMRLELAGEGFREERYGAALDHLVSSLDGMSERNVVPGRVFTPSTLHDRDGLLSPMVAFLLAAVPAEGDDGLKERVESLAQDEAALPDADRSLRHVLGQLKRMSTILEHAGTDLTRALHGLKPEKDFDLSVATLRTIIEDSISAIDARRLERLKKRPLDEIRLERIRSAVEAALLEPPAGVLFFQEFSIKRGAPTTEIEPYTYTLGNLSKAQFVNPPMEPESLNLDEYLVQTVQNHAARRVWGLFTSRPRERVVLSDRVVDEAFWRAIREAAERVGPAPILLVSMRAEGRVIHRLLHRAQAEKPNIKIEKKQGGGRFYVATVEGFDVYGVEFDPGTAWLFSSRILRQVIYSALDTSARPVEMTFEPLDDKTGALRFRFIQSAEWMEYPTFEFRIDDRADEAEKH